MIHSIKAEWRKNRLRPAFVVAACLIAAMVVLVYSVELYQALHPAGSRQAISLLTLYPDQMVNYVTGLTSPLGAAIALALGALIAGSEYSWGTLKTVLTQGPGRVSSLVGRVVALQLWMGALTIIIFATGAACSLVVASTQGHAIVFPTALDIAKGVGSVWLILGVNSSFGMALGSLFRQPAAALGVGLTYVIVLETIVARVIGGFNNGAYQWIANLFDNQNANALLQSFTSPAFGRAAAPAIGAEQAAFVLFAYLAVFLLASAALLRQRDLA